MLNRPTSERGAILIHTAIALLALTAFSAFAIDYGIMWTSRGQVQTAADAAAISGAYALTFDNVTEAEVKERAQVIGLRNDVWLTDPDIQLSDITLVPCPPTTGLPPGDTCIKVDAYRNQDRNNSLPMWFGHLVGMTEQGVRATATARAVSGTSVQCLKPWAVGDKWLEGDGTPWSQTATYDEPDGDTYVPPSPGNDGTGFSAKKPDGTPDYYGYQMILKLANPGSGPNDVSILSAGWAMELCLENPASNNACNTPAYTNNISDCTSDVVSMSPFGSGPCADVDPALGCLGVKTGSSGNNNATALADFISTHDPNAYWVNGSGAAGWQTGHIETDMGTSSRIVPIAVFDLPQYIAQGYSGGNGIVRVVKIVGFFVEGTCETTANIESYVSCPGGGNDKAAILGRLVNYPLQGPVGPANGGFGTFISLVR